MLSGTRMFKEIFVRLGKSVLACRHECYRRYSGHIFHNENI